ncbi:hypothetical protein [Paraburkholderia pallida]|nr:hypothetical protein [Paraburkholderia pallida]
MILLAITVLPTVIMARVNCRCATDRDDDARGDFAGDSEEDMGRSRD